jgi:hypothetical protein
MARRERFPHRDDRPRAVAEIGVTFGPPLVLVALALAPGWAAATLYSATGGPAWLGLALCFPYVLVRLAAKIAWSRGARRRYFLGFAAVAIPAYLVLAYPLARVATRALEAVLGVPLAGAFYYVMTLPLSLLWG